MRSARSTSAGVGENSSFSTGQLQRMDRAGRDEAQSFRAPDDGAEGILVAEIGDGADETHRQMPAARAANNVCCFG